MKHQRPIIHARDHLPGGADPMPGLTGTGSWEDTVRNEDLTAWWRMGDTFTFASTVADALIDSADFDVDSPRNLDYAEASSADRPTLHVANSELGADDDGAVEFTASSFASGHRFYSTAGPVEAVTQFGTTGDLAQTVTCWLKVTTNPGFGAGIYGPVIGRWGMDTTGAFNVGWVLEVEQTTYQLRFRVGIDLATVPTITGPTLTPGTWYHAAVTWDGTTWNLYVDGLLYDDVAGSTAPTDPAADPFQIGYANYDSGITFAVRLFYGSVDEVAFYRRPLDADEISAIASGEGSSVGGGGAIVVTSLAEQGETPLTGNVTLSEGTNVTLTQAGQNIQIAATGGGGGAPVDDTEVWMPLTTVVGGVPELVWDGDDNLIPTLTPV